MADIEGLLNKQAQKNEEERSAEKWDPNKGDILEGIILRTGWYDKGDYDPSLWFILKDMEGDTHRVYCPAVLKDQLNDMAPAMGSGIAVRYEGKVPAKTGNRSYHMHTLALVPDKDGNVKQDHAYWAVHGEYMASMGPQSADTTTDEEPEGGWF